MVTFSSITAFASTVIRGKEQGFHVHAMSGKPDSISKLLVLEKYRRGLSSVRKDFFLTNRTPPGFLILQAFHPGPSCSVSESMPFADQSPKYCCKITTAVVFTVWIAPLSPLESIGLISSRKQHSSNRAAYVSY